MSFKAVLTGPCIGDDAALVAMVVAAFTVVRVCFLTVTCVCARTPPTVCSVTAVGLAPKTVPLLIIIPDVQHCTSADAAPEQSPTWTSP